MYPAWPDDDTATGAHSLVQSFARNLAAFVTEQANQGISQAELGRPSGLAKATVSKIFHCGVWPDSVTVAHFEQLTGRRLWNGPISDISPNTLAE